jgi:hypothetical protein
MRSVRKGNGIKLPDETLETASFRTLVAVYSHLIYLGDIDNVSKVISEFQRYFYREYEHLFGVLKYRISQFEIGSRVEGRLKQYKSLLKENALRAPSQILEEFIWLKQVKKQLGVKEVNQICCMKLY